MVCGVIAGGLQRKISLTLHSPDVIAAYSLTLCTRLATAWILQKALDVLRIQRVPEILKLAGTEKDLGHFRQRGPDGGKPALQMTLP